MASDRLRDDRAGKIVVIDSSAIMMLFEFSINLKEELIRLIGAYSIVVTKQIIDEIKYLSDKGKGKKRNIARPALKFIEDLEIMDAEGNADNSVIDLASRLNAIVFTNDKEIRKKAKEKGLKTIYLRGKNKLEMSY